MRGLHPSSRAASPRTGFTLLELILVLAVLVAAVSIVLPSLNRMLSDHQLKQVVDEVRSKLASTRMRAIDAGVSYQFLYEPGGRKFLILPYESLDVAMPRLAQQGPGFSEGDYVPYGALGELPEGMRFSEFPAGDPGHQIPADQLSEFPNPQQLSTTVWCSPLLFHPDGTAGNAVFSVIDSKHQQVRLSLRGLTGAVKVSRVSMEEKRL